MCPADHDAADMQSAVSRMLLQALPPTPTESSAPDDIKAAPVANQSATAAAAVILVMNLYGSSLAPFGRSQQAALVNVLGNTTNSVPANTKLLSVSEYTPNNTTPSSPAARRHLLFHRRFLGKLAPCLPVFAAQEAASYGASLQAC